MSYNQVRPPSRQKDIPQGLDRKQNDDDNEELIPSFDEDSDSLDEFEIGIQNAQNQPKKGIKKMTSFDRRAGNNNKNFQQPFVPLND